LTACSLPGADRAQSLAKQLAQILDRDASDAPITLGAEESSIVENLEWAREVRKALNNELGTDAKEAVDLAAGIAALPKVGVLEKLGSSTAIIRDELNECLAREDFFTVASDIRTRLTALREQVKSAASGLGQEIATHLDAQRESITNLPAWSELPAEDRSEFSAKLDGTTLPEATDLAGIRQLLNSRMELDANMAQTRAAVTERHTAMTAEKALPAVTPVPSLRETPGEPTPLPMKIRVRRKYSPSDHADLETTIGALTTGLQRLKSHAATEISIDLD
jgi:hypothetical protein